MSPSPPGGISSPKTRAVPPIYDKARSEKVRNPRKEIRSRDDDSDDSDDQHRRGGRKPARPEKVTDPDPLPTRTRNGIDFSSENIDLVAQPVERRLRRHQNFVVMAVVKNQKMKEGPGGEKGKRSCFFFRASLLCLVSPPLTNFLRSRLVPDGGYCPRFGVRKCRPGGRGTLRERGHRVESGPRP